MSGLSHNVGGPLLIVGDVVTDIVCAPEAPWRIGSDTDAAISVRAGGSAANTAAWAAVARPQTSPISVVFIGRVGSDDATWHSSALADVGVDPRLVLDTTTATTRLVALIDKGTGERTMLTDRGAGTRLAPADIDDALLASAAWVHLSGYLLFAPSPQATFRHIVERCRSMRIAWSVDPASVGYLADLGRDRARSLLGGASIGFPNADEARWLAGLSHDADVESSACALTEIWGTVVVKCGSDGAVVARQGSIVQRAAAEKCSVVDAVGAGDAFAGAWLSTRLGGGPETECLDAALGAASAAIGIVGGRPHPPE